jgi:biopolymer transport protein ExbD
MRRKKHLKLQEEVELDVTSFMNLMVVLIPFLLATAVFSQVTIQELNVPSPGVGGATPDKPLVTIEVMVRKESIEISNGKVITNRFPKEEGEYDLEALTGALLNLKEQHPDKEDATVLLEPDIEYNDMIAVMDTVKFHDVASEDGEDQSQVLFPEISIGDAP